MKTTCGTETWPLTAAVLLFITQKWLPHKSIHSCHWISFRRLDVLTKWGCYSNTLQKLPVCYSNALGWGFKCRWSLELLQYVTDGYTREVRPVAFIKPGCYYSDTFHFRAAHLLGHLYQIWIFLKSLVVWTLSELHRGKNTTECKSFSGALPSAFAESEKLQRQPN